MWNHWVSYVAYHWRGDVLSTFSISDFFFKMRIVYTAYSFGLVSRSVVPYIPDGGLVTTRRRSRRVEFNRTA